MGVAYFFRMFYLYFFLVDHILLTLLSRIMPSKNRAKRRVAARRRWKARPSDQTITFHSDFFWFSFEFEDYSSHLDMEVPEYSLRDLLDAEKRFNKYADKYHSYYNEYITRFKETVSEYGQHRDKEIEDRHKLMSYLQPSVLEKIETAKSIRISFINSSQSHASYVNRELQNYPHDMP